MEQPYSILDVVLRYCRNQIVGSNAHGIHSPMIFDLYNHLKAYPKADLSSIYTYHSALKSDKRFITFIDPGRENELSKKTISDIAKVSAKGKREGKMLHQITSFFQPKSILEFGTSLGISGLYQHLAAPDATFTSIEGVPEVSSIARKQFNLTSPKMQVRDGLFSEIIPLLKDENQLYDFVYLDGHHQQNATLTYVSEIKSILTAEACIVLDDIHWSAGMEAAWDTLTKDKDVAISVDLFHFGILIFRQGIEKQHFTLKV